eukprot:483952-Rhodomonas_salina.1
MSHRSHPRSETTAQPHRSCQCWLSASGALKLGSLELGSLGARRVEARQGARAKPGSTWVWVAMRRRRTQAVRAAFTGRGYLSQNTMASSTRLVRQAQRKRSWSTVALRPIA